jgi:hypothetical protein
MRHCKSGGKDFKRDYAKEQLRENIGQSESKERVFKEQKRRLYKQGFVGFFALLSRCFSSLLRYSYVHTLFGSFLPLPLSQKQGFNKL